MSLEKIEVLLDNLRDKQFEIVITNYNYIYKNFKLVKLSEKRLSKIDELMEEILNKSHNKEHIKYLLSKIRTEKIIVRMYKHKVLRNLNLTG